MTENSKKNHVDFIEFKRDIGFPVGFKVPKGLAELDEAVVKNLLPYLRALISI